MKKVLLLLCSIQNSSDKGSVSNEMLKVFLKEYQKHNKNDKIIKMDLNDDLVGSRVLTSQNVADGTFFGDGTSDKYIDLIKNVDKIVVANPYMNFNIAATLKSFLDHIMVAKKTFIYKYDRNGISQGLMTHLNVQILSARGGNVGLLNTANHTKYLEGAFKFIGAKVADSVEIFGTNAPENYALKAREIVNQYRNHLVIAARKF